MMAIAMAILGAFIVAANLAVTVPVRETAFVESKLDADVASFMTYREACIRALNANPSLALAGTVSDTNLGHVSGMVNNGRWKNWVLPAIGGTLIVYSTTPQSTSFVRKLAERNRWALTVGVKGDTGMLVHPVAGELTYLLPAHIQVGSAVIYGN